MVDNKKTFNWISLIIGIAFILVSFVAFRNPYETLASLVIYFGLIAIIKGIGGLIIYRNIRESTKLNIRLFVWNSVIDIILGLLLIVNVDSAVSILPYVFAIWFIVDSINDMFYARFLKYIHDGVYGLNMAVNIITLILGIMMLNNPMSASLTLVYLIGIYFTISGIKYIVYAFEHEY